MANVRRNSHSHNQSTDYNPRSTPGGQNLNSNENLPEAHETNENHRLLPGNQFEEISAENEKAENGGKGRAPGRQLYSRSPRTATTIPQRLPDSATVIPREDIIHEGKFGRYTAKFVVVNRGSRKSDISIDDVAIVRTMLPAQSAKPTSGQQTWQSKNDSPFLYPNYHGEHNVPNMPPVHSTGNHMQTGPQKRSSAYPSAPRDHGQPRKYVHIYDQNPRNRKELFEPYLSLEEVQHQLDNHQLYHGTLRINGRRRYEAYVTCDDLDSDIFINGDCWRNRALEGDLVAVSLIEDVDKIWNMRKKKLRKQDSTGDSADSAMENEEDEEDEKDQSKPKYCGKIVCIVHRGDNLSFAGTITIERPRWKKPEKPEVKEVKKPNEKSNNNDDSETDWEEGQLPPTEIKRIDVKVAWFKPIDKRSPLIVIPIQDAPPDLVDDEASYKDKVLVAKVTRWPITSNNPFGKIIKVLGNVGSISAETNAIITNCNIRDKPFGSIALQGLPTSSWTIPQEEYVKRRICDDVQIFTIDPATAKDLDDAVHIKSLDDTVFEVGVHIADVTYFVKPHSPLDTEAAERGTSTYLVDRVVPMLPEVLCEKLCSLNPGVERLAFSVIWKMDAFGKVLDTWMGKTIIKSCAKLSYDDAQSVLDGFGLPSGANVSSTADTIGIQKNIFELSKLASNMRRRRFDGGALSMNSVKLSFTLNDKGGVESVQTYELKEANRLIEEFMICANVSVAQKIAKHYPNMSLLRRHEAPVAKKLREFYIITEELGYDFDISSAGGFQASLDAIESGDTKEVLLQLAIKPMRRAKYFCTGSVDISKYAHYALNEPLYTHFTSPIRRYADVIVHRQLNAAINGQGSPFTKRSAQTLAFRCDSAKNGAKNAQDGHIMLYLAHYLHRVELDNGPELQKALVLYVLDNAIDIYVPQYGLERRVYMDILPLESFEFDMETKSLVVIWKTGVKADRSMEEKLFALREMGKAGSKQKENTAAEPIKDRPAEQLDVDDLEDQSTSKMLPKLPSASLQNDEIDEEKKTQRFKVFSKLDVSIQVNIYHSPPLIYVYPANPFC
ncbi:hypothetical protein DFQ28_008477 [Apophysomyces sp. BC1034]|nr:hypothetical protein DFQ30_008178 [Apophysomyces sp. BC1015]KAG0175275.1 hypothetical protein DFQ29_007217 [Apophysomyces sp. BC1021]KAG0185981.1 hypothetical protein DFQ28_008477 [Apophysomyces sp. BC1034]